MNIRRVLVIYKKSAFQIHAVERRDATLRRLRRSGHPFIRTMERADRQHRRTLEEVERVLTKEGLKYRLLFRTEFTAEEGYDLIVTVGGDGTLLIASHQIRAKPVIAVNSARESVGYLCGADRSSFRPLLRKILEGRARPAKLHRLQVKIGRKPVAIPVLNEILFTNQNPAATSRYRIRVGRREEEQKSSGVYIATAAGSTAAMKSAGGRVLPLGSRKFQYIVRELYREDRGRHSIETGVIAEGAKIRLIPKMRHAMIYIDGPHLSWGLEFAEPVEVTGGASPLRVFGLPRRHDKP